MQGINPSILMPSINFDKLILNKSHIGLFFLSDYKENLSEQNSYWIFFCQITKKI